MSSERFYKILNILKKAMFEPNISYRQCQHNSAGWIDKDGGIYWLPLIEHEISNEVYPLSHSEYAKKEFANDNIDDYIRWLESEGALWLKVSNSKEASMDNLGKVKNGNLIFPNDKQLSAFVKMHLRCVRLFEHRYYNSAKFTLELRDALTPSRRPFLSLSVDDFISKYAPDLKAELDDTYKYLLNKY